jgi:nucleoside-diphosphate-sugar epimerase
VFETARILGLGRVIFTGSVSMYGDTEEPCMETDMVNPLNIASFYDFAKYTGENLMHTYHNVFGMDTVICRLHNAYGIGEIRPKAIGTWLWNVMRGENVVETTGADNRDDNSYSGDIAEGVYILYTTKKITEPRIYNVSDGVTRRHGDIVEVINRMGSGEVVLGPGKGGIYGKPMYRKEELKDKMEVGGKYVKGGSPLICDITRMKELGFRPRPIEENIAEYAEWVKDEINRLGPLAKPRETY